MLILTRKQSEVVRIGNDIEVIVLGIVGRQVRLGFKAPKDVSVHRQEVYDRIIEELEKTGEENVR